jgi:hypothetical protein
MSRREPLKLDDLQPGTFKIRLVRNGPWVAAELIVARGMITTTEDGSPVLAPVPVTALADLLVEATMEGEAFRHPLFRLLYFGVRIDRDEYEHLLETAAWARRHSPRSAAANPGRPVDLGTVPIRDLF